MIDCQDLVKLLIDFVADELPPEHRSKIEKHLSNCSPCLHYVETYQLTIRLTRQLPAVPLPKGFMERLLAGLKEIQEDQQQRDCQA